jgi:anti-sigma regulatory factor (Ser/Thr protein kinase)
MCRVVTHGLGSGVGAVARAREATRRQLAAWDLRALELDVTLLVSELVTNAVVHAHGAVQLTLAVADGVLEAGVTDASTEHAMPRTGRDPRGRAAGRAEDWAEGGRGLHMLDALAEDWGVATAEKGKQVWFRRQLPEQWPFAAQCPCGGEDLDGVRLQSGLHALAVAGPWDER